MLLISSSSPSPVHFPSLHIHFCNTYLSDFPPDYVLSCVLPAFPYQTNVLLHAITDCPFSCTLPASLTSISSLLCIRLTATTAFHLLPAFLPLTSISSSSAFSLYLLLPSSYFYLLLLPPSSVLLCLSFPPFMPTIFVLGSFLLFCCSFVYPPAIMRAPPARLYSLGRRGRHLHNALDKQQLEPTHCCLLPSCHTTPSFSLPHHLPLPHVFPHIQQFLPYVLPHLSSLPSCLPATPL